MTKTNKDSNDKLEKNESSLSFQKKNDEEIKGNVPVKNKRQRFLMRLKKLKNIKSAGWMAFIGDILHKSADGFAIGASFAQSLSLGVSTSLAILFHEIPHELGDYAVLQGAGFELWSILILNAFTSFVSLIAFFIIASVSPSELIREYIFAIVTGVFLYIAIANMVCLSQLIKTMILFIFINFLSFFLRFQELSLYFSLTQVASEV